MATAKKPTRKTTTTRRKSSSSKSAGQKSAGKSAGSLITRLYRHPIGRIALIIVAVILLIGLNFLLTLNHFERFFILLGIEWIAANLIGWLFFVFRDRLKSRN
ncbi:MAG: hypothetical protein JW780_01925 [Clostridiales bacterium]|nr:hypothetical protein [Clostridiales bacterium]